MKLKANFSAKGIPENDNCYIRAVATAMNTEYDEALMLCLEAGWDHGMPHALAVEMAVAQGWNVIACQGMRLEVFFLLLMNMLRSSFQCAALECCLRS